MKYTKQYTQAYFVGKPSPIIMNHALKKFDSLPRNEVVIIGDNMDTDILHYYYLLLLLYY